MTRPPAPLDPLADLLAALRQATPARVALGRAGHGLPTRPMLDFQLAHAQAQDAVHATLDVEALKAALPIPSLAVASAARDRSAYLANPDLGRRLDPTGPALPRVDQELIVVIADGLSATAVQAHAPAVVSGLIHRLRDWRWGPPVIVRQGRVAIGDAIGEVMGARAVVVLIGERPGLSAADSLGAYLTWAPRRGRRDHERNCVSNIRPDGLAPDLAADKIAWLLREARRLGLTGVELKDRQAAIDGADAVLPTPAHPPALQARHRPA